MLSRWLSSKQAWSLGLALMAAVVLVAINETGYNQSSQALVEISRAQQTRFAVTMLLQNTLDAETGQRGYLLTQEPIYREPYDHALKEVDLHLASLRELCAGRPEELASVARLSNHLSRKMAEMDMTLRFTSKGDNDASRFVLTTDVGREEMSRIRQETARLVGMSNDSLADAQRQIAKSLTLSRIGIALVAIAGLAAFCLYLRQSAALQSANERQQMALQRERNRLEEEVRDRTASLAELATHLQDVRESERGFLARELHDELGSLLTAAKLDVARLKSRLVDLPDATQRLQHLTELLNSGIALKRRIIEDLRPSSLSNLGLEASLEILSREFAERSGVRVEMVLEPVSLDESRQLTIYRMVQESLTNIGKYADATEATVVLRNYDNHVIVEVNDNGKGFDPARTRPSTHGLAGMRHRVEAAGGRLSVSSAPGQGTRLHAVLPTHSPHDANAGAGPFPTAAAQDH